MTESASGASLAMIPSAGRGEVRLELLAVEGVDEGRARFERLVTDIVRVILPNAREIEARPGDWGIDTFVGQLDDGDIVVWQSKFFLHPGDSLKAQQAEVRDSFRSVTTRADTERLKLVSWTLAVPGTMDAPMTKWFDGWKTRARSQRAGEIEIGVWQNADIRGLLMKPDFAHIRAQYFGPDPAPQLRHVDDPEDPNAYDSALFIRQLHEAKIRTDGPARRAFFNAEVMTRDINEREAVAEVGELRTMRSVVEQLWSTRFEAARAAADPEDDSGQLRGLYPEVCAAIERHHGDNPNPVLRDTLVHRTGLVHHLAEAGRAGWVEHYETVAEAYLAGAEQ